MERETTMEIKHDKKEIVAALNSVEVAVVSTFAGEQVRSRMMHYAVDEELNVYIATMKGDPKTIQLTHHPSVTVLGYKQADNINEARETEITGKAFFIKSDEEKANAFKIIAPKSPVVNYMLESGNEDRLDCIKILQERIKYRIFGEIVQGLPPTVLEFPQHRDSVSDFVRLRKKLKSWIISLRTPFLTASIIPVLLGSVIAWVQTGAFFWIYFLLTLVAGLFMHAGTNIINDYFDHKSGNDEFNREFIRLLSGGSRVIHLGWLTPLELLVASVYFFVLGRIIGLYLAYSLGLMVLALGMIGIISGICYSVMPFNVASKGIG